MAMADKYISDEVKKLVDPKNGLIRPTADPVNYETVKAYCEHIKHLDYLQAEVRLLELNTKLTNAVLLMYVGERTTAYAVQQAMEVVNRTIDQIKLALRTLRGVNHV